VQSYEDEEIVGFKRGLEELMVFISGLKEWPRNHAFPPPTPLPQRKEVLKPSTLLNRSLLCFLFSP
jgi:hypothetical protein